MINNTADRAKLNSIHFIDSCEGLVAPSFDIDPTRVREIVEETPRVTASGEIINRTTRSGKELKSFEYVIAISGDTELDRANAAHELHDRLLHFPTEHGIFATYNSQIGVSQQLLNTLIPTNARTGERSDLTGKDYRKLKRLDEFREELRGHRMLVVRGTFEDEQSFLNAFQEAVNSSPGQHLKIPTLASPTAEVLTLPLAVAGEVLVVAGRAGLRVDRNIPASALIKSASLATLATGKAIGSVVDAVHDFSIRRQPPCVGR